MDNITEFPAPPKTEWMIGPFEEYRVMVEGRVIPKLTAYKDGNLIGLVVDKRFSISLPEDQAKTVAWLVANALAIGAGYSHLGAESKDQPFAPLGKQL